MAPIIPKVRMIVKTVLVRDEGQPAGTIRTTATATASTSTGDAHEALGQGQALPREEEQPADEGRDDEEGDAAPRPRGEDADREQGDEARRARRGGGRR